MYIRIHTVWSYVNNVISIHVYVHVYTHAPPSRGHGSSPHQLSLCQSESVDGSLCPVMQGGRKEERANKTKQVKGSSSIMCTNVVILTVTMCCVHVPQD